jgi:hypothetical protein
MLASARGLDRGATLRERQADERSEERGRPPLSGRTSTRRGRGAVGHGF